MSDFPSFEGEYFRKKSGFHHSNSINTGVAAFGHLPHSEETSNIHWAFSVLKMRMESGKIIESNEACIEMLNAFKHFFQEYELTSNKAPSRDLEEKLEQINNFLVTTNILTLGMETAIQYLKMHVLKFPLNITSDKISEEMCEIISTFIKEKIELPASLISTTGANIIKNSDVILIYDYSLTVIKTLLEAKSSGKNFRVIVTDSRTRLDGKKSLKALVKAKIHCTYILISNVSYHMPEVTRVVLGAEGVYNNCYLLNKVGTAMICCIANAFKKPVLVCVETYKLSEKVQLDSFCFNVLSPGSVFTNTSMYEGDTRIQSCLSNFMSSKLLKLNLKYDVTPPKYIDMLITEVGAIPVSSVPVVLREFRSESEIF